MERASVLRFETSGFRFRIDLGTSRRRERLASQLIAFQVNNIYMERLSIIHLIEAVVV